jgi:hypothetical protein
MGSCASAPARRGATVSAVHRLRSLLASLLLSSALAQAQGTVQLRDPRRPPPLEALPQCELWRGHIAGNDPTAEATLQLCTTGDDVTGVFLWTAAGTAGPSSGAGSTRGIGWCCTTPP